MKRILAFALAICITCPAVATTADMLQEKPVAPLSTTAIGEVAPVIMSIMTSNMEPAAKERSVTALTELARYQIEQREAGKKSFWSSFFEWSLKLIAAGASIYSVVRVTT